MWRDFKTRGLFISTFFKTRRLHRKLFAHLSSYSWPQSFPRLLTDSDLGCPESSRCPSRRPPAWWPRKSRRVRGNSSQRSSTGRASRWPHPSPWRPRRSGRCWEAECRWERLQPEEAECWGCSRQTERRWCRWQRTREASQDHPELNCIPAGSWRRQRRPAPDLPGRRFPDKRQREPWWRSLTLACWSKQRPEPENCCDFKFSTITFWKLNPKRHVWFDS